MKAFLFSIEQIQNPKDLFHTEGFATFKKALKKYFQEGDILKMLILYDLVTVLHNLKENFKIYSEIPQYHKIFNFDSEAGNLLDITNRFEEALSPYYHIIGLDIIKHLEVSGLVTQQPQAKGPLKLEFMFNSFFSTFSTDYRVLRRTINGKTI